MGQGNPSPGPHAPQFMSHHPTMHLPPSLSLCAGLALLLPAEPENPPLERPHRHPHGTLSAPRSRAPQGDFGHGVQHLHLKFLDESWKRTVQIFCSSGSFIHILTTSALQTAQNMVIHRPLAKTSCTTTPPKVLHALVDRPSSAPAR